MSWCDNDRYCGSCGDYGRRDERDDRYGGVYDDRYDHFDAYESRKDDRCGCGKPRPDHCRPKPRPCNNSCCDSLVLLTLCSCLCGRR